MQLVIISERLKLS